ncbi:MAG: tetratricopeptide repeat protein [Terriglobia bacterium]
MRKNPETPRPLFWESLLDGALNEETKKYIGEQRQALAANPSDPRPYFHLGLLYNMQRNPEAAIEMFKQALALDPGFALAHQHLGQLYAVLGDYPKAWVHAREAAARGNTTLLDMLRRYPQATRPSE